MQILSQFKSRGTSTINLTLQVVRNSFRIFSYRSYRAHFEYGILY